METLSLAANATPEHPTGAGLVARLRCAYGEPPLIARLEPIDELVATILSQHTSDSNTERSFAELRRRFPTWLDVVNATDDEVADAIRSGGLADVKAPRIRCVLTEVMSRRGSFDLNFLRELPISEAKHWLISLPGVGPKTAACVLLFSLGMPAMPVDTHVYRVALRLGLIPERTTAVRAHDIIEAQFTPEEMLPAHLLFIQHGRRTCHARRPRCRQCTLRAVCPSKYSFDADDRKVG